MTTALFPVVILAGGLATRLRPITSTIPKSLIEVNGEPFIDHQLRLLRKQGIRQVVLCLGFLGDLIEKHVGNGNRYGLQVQYSYDGDKLLGTGGAIKRALPLLSDQFFVLYGDSYLTCDYAHAQAAYILQGKLGMMTVYKNLGKWDTSNIEYTAGRIVTYDKINRTERMQYIDYGLGVLSKDAFSYMPSESGFDLAMLYQELLKDNQLGSSELYKSFYEIGSVDGIKRLVNFLSNLDVATTCDQMCN